MRNNTINKRNYSADSRLSPYFAKRLRRTDFNKFGYTIVELIVVISIIGILASIVIVSYSSWKQSTTTAQLKSDLNGVASAMENARTFGNTYPTTIPSTFVSSNGVTLSGGGLNSGKGYCVDATNGTQSYYISSLYTTPQVGGCPVLNLDAGISASYPGTGITWTDLSGDGNNGILMNGVGYSGANGGALTFDGMNDYVNTTAVNIGTNSVTFAAWVKGASVQSTIEYGIISVGGGVNNWHFTLERSSWGSGYLNMYAGYTILSPASIPGGVWSPTDTTWHHVVMTRSAIAMKLYFDGIEVASSSYAGFTNWNVGNNVIRIGYPSQNYWNGSIASVSIYNRALTADEIKQNFNALKGRFGV